MPLPYCCGGIWIGTKTGGRFFRCDRGCHCNAYSSDYCIELLFKEYVQGVIKRRVI